MAATTSSFTSAFWQGGDDGPWRLTSFDSAGNATFESNPHYSGPQAAQVHSVKEVAYTSESTEVSDLQSGKLDIGYVEPSDLTSPAPKSGSAGPNLPALNAKYRLSVATPYAFNFAEMNYSTSNPLQAEFEELYIRQALQESLDEAGIVRNVDDNYAVANYSPLPPTASPALAKAPKSAYAYNLSSAKALLTSHGWSEVGNVMTCTSPGATAGHCGTNIAQGATLAFTLLYVTGNPTIDATVNAMVSDWQSIGVSVTATATTFNLLATTCTTGSGTPWSMCWSGQSWTYEPNLYPSGEQTFLIGRRLQLGRVRRRRDEFVDRRRYATSKATLSTYEQYAANQLPVLYLPTQEVLTETARSLKTSAGWASNGLSDFLPEYLHY